MGDIVDYIVEKENEAEEILNKAREKSSEIIREADMEVSSKISKAREKAQHILQDDVNKVEKDIEAKKEEEIKKINKEFDSFLEENKNIIDDIVIKVIECITRTEFDEVI